MALNANTVWELQADATANNVNGGGFRWLNLCSSTYKWTKSGSGTNEYYCEIAAGGDPSLTEAQCCTTDGTFKLDTNGTMGSLTAGQWDWGDNDSLGYSTVYVRLDDDTDPDTKPFYVQIGNGGGYDYTQQTAAQLALTDGYRVAASSLYSDTGGFTALMVGNLVHIASGTHFTAGWYEITGYTSTNQVTLDRDCASEDTSAHKDAVFKVGGAMSMNSTLDNDLFLVAVSGNRFYIKNGTYLIGESVSCNVSATAILPVKLIGYNSTRGDSPTGSTRPTFSTNGNSTSISNTNYWKCYNIIFSNSSDSVSSALICGNHGYFYNCKFINTRPSETSTGVSCGQAGNIFINCEMVAVRGNGVVASSSGFFIFNCWIHDCITGISHGNTSVYMFIRYNIIESCKTYAINYNAAGTNFGSISNNTFYGSENTTGTGLNLIDSVGNLEIKSNIFYGFVTGLNVTTLANSFGLEYDYNNYYNNDTDVSNIRKGANDQAINPAFTNVTQVTGTAAKTLSSNRLQDTSKDFTALGVVANQDCVYVVSGTGVTAGIYLITAITTVTNSNDTLTLSPTISANSTTDKVYQITCGHNFAIGGSL